MKTSSDLLNDKFRSLVTSVIESAKADSVPYLYNKTEIYLGDHFISKVKDSYIVYKNKQVVSNEACYFLLESAMMVSVALQRKRVSLLYSIQDLDKKFTKYYFDCLHLYRTITTLRKGDDEDNSRANTLVVKYDYAKEKRNHYKTLIRQLCLINIKK